MDSISIPPISFLQSKKKKRVEPNTLKGTGERKPPAMCRKLHLKEQSDAQML